MPSFRRLNRFCRAEITQGTTMSIYKPKLSPYYHYDFQVRGRRFYGNDPKRTSPRTPDVRFVLPERQQAKDINAHDQCNACNVAFALAVRRPEPPIEAPAG